MMHGTYNVNSVKTSKPVDGCQYLTDNITLGTLRVINSFSET
jgi:hypothetical protein